VPAVTEHFCVQMIAATNEQTCPEVSELRVAERLCLSSVFHLLIYRENVLLATQENATKSPKAFIFSSVVFWVLRN